MQLNVLHTTLIEKKLRDTFGKLEETVLVVGTRACSV